VSIYVTKWKAPLAAFSAERSQWVHPEAQLLT